VCLLIFSTVSVLGFPISGCLLLSNPPLHADGSGEAVPFELIFGWWNRIYETEIICLESFASSSFRELLNVIMIMILYY
jgi:hypothetical protein